MSQQIPKFLFHRPNTSAAVGDRDVLVGDTTVLRSYGYFVFDIIDSGTFATVRHAQKMTFTRVQPLAVKIINISQVTSTFLLRELNIWPHIRHSHIIHIDKSIQIQNRMYIFMELAPKGSIISYIHKYGAVAEEQSRIWCRQLCQALRYCHMRGVAHRDIKCDNLLLDKDLKLKIGDFGFCCRMRTGNPTLSDTYCGSPNYIAPEILARQPYDPNPVDVWSAGVSMYVIFNDWMPFDASDRKKMYENQITKNWAFKNEVDEKLSDSAKNVVKRMLEPDPARRPSMEHLLRCNWLRR